MQMSDVSRLKDPKRVCTKEDGSYDHARLALLQKKVSDCMTKMFRKPEGGGNPFLYALTLPKPHELAIELPGPNGKDFHTAATDGKKFWWHPDFLEKLDSEEVPTVMEHEGYHVILFHPQRGVGTNPRIFNWAIDYVVNAIIETNHKQLNRKGKLWGGNLGEPLSFADLLSYIDGNSELPKDKNSIFVDVSLHGRSPESIYEEIMDHWDKSPRKCSLCTCLSIDPKTGKPIHALHGKSPVPPEKPHDPHCDGTCCPKCGVKSDPLGSMDAHIPGALTKDEVMADIMRARDQSTAMRGTVPSEVEDALKELMKPTLKFTDIVKSCFMRKIQDAGMKNDWKRCRRRWLASNPKQYLPRRHTHRPRWLAMVDTSGSMQDDDLLYGISQLKVLGDNTEGYVIPCDASPKWDAMQKIDKATDLQRTKIVGRGGTVFDQFFQDFPKKIGTDFDVVVIITDGDCGTIPLHLKPPCDVVWVITRTMKEYKPSFGRVAPLRPSRM